MEGGKK